VTRSPTIGVAGPMDLHLLAGHLRTPTPASNGYAARVVSELILELIERDRRVVAFTASPNALDVGTYGGENLEVIVVPYRARARWVDAFRAERRALGAAMVAHPCDIIHAHWTYEFALAAMQSGTPHLVTVRDWGPQVLRYQKHPYRAVRLGMQAKVLAGADNLTANSPYIAKRVSRWFRREIPVIPNGIVVPPSLPQREFNELLTIGALNNGFGTLKNVAALLEAFRQVRETFGSARLRLVGTDYEQGGPAHTWAVERGLDDGVEFRGPIPASDVPAFMRSLDLFVHPSLEESFGRVLLEAIIEGTPVIAGSESGAVPWVLGYGEAGTLTDVRSADQLAQAMLRLIEDSEKHRAISERALAHVRNHFSLPATIQQYERVYQQILERPDG